MSRQFARKLRDHRWHWIRQFEFIETPVAVRFNCIRLYYFIDLHLTTIVIMSTYYYYFIHYFTD